MDKSNFHTNDPVPASRKSVELLTANPARMTAMFYNESPHMLYVNFGNPASVYDWIVRIKPGAYFELPQPVFTGDVNGAWDGDSGFCKVTELS